MIDIDKLETQVRRGLKFDDKDVLSPTTAVSDLRVELSSLVDKRLILSVHENIDPLHDKDFRYAAVYLTVDTAEQMILYLQAWLDVRNEL